MSGFGPLGDKRNEKRPPNRGGLCPFVDVNWSVLETLIAAPPPGIGRPRTIFRDAFGAFDVVMSKRLCTLNWRHSGPGRGRAIAGRSGESVAAVTGASLADATVRSDTVLWATGRGPGFCGLANCLGAPTTTLGSKVTPLEGGSVCDIAVPLEPHTRPATKSDKNLIALSSQMPGGRFRPGAEDIKFYDRFDGISP
jgi:hypothetical protein